MMSVWTCKRVKRKRTYYLVAVVTNANIPPIPTPKNINTRMARMASYAFMMIWVDSFEQCSRIPLSFQYYRSVDRDSPILDYYNPQ